MHFLILSINMRCPETITQPRDHTMSLDFDSARLPNPPMREEHHEWRTQLRRFIDTEIMPHAEAWDEAGHIPIELWPKAAAVGLLGLGYPEEFGGVNEGIDCWHRWIATSKAWWKWCWMPRPTP